MKISYQEQTNIDSFKRILVDFFPQETKNRRLDAEKAAIEADFVWNASLFFGKVLSISTKFKGECTYNDFFNFKSNYELEKQTIVDSDNIFSKFWLRKVLNFVELPSTISSVLFTFEKIAAYKKELSFLQHFLKDNSLKQKIVSEEKIERGISSFEKKHNIALKKEGIYLDRWAEKKEQGVKFSDIETYFEPFLGYWEDFEFLLAFRNYRYNATKERLTIPAADFNQLHTSFSSFYNRTPSIQELKEQGVIKKTANSYQLDFYNNSINYWSALADKITSFYWDILLNDNSFSSDEERLLNFLSKISYWNSFGDPLLNSHQEAKIKFLNAAFNLIIQENDINGITAELQKTRIDSKSSNEMYALFHGKQLLEDYSLNNTDLFELYESLEKWEKKAQVELLFGQRTRCKLFYLIRMLVKHDFEYEPTDDKSPRLERFKRVLALLDVSLNKPILLWKLASSIANFRKELIPYLLHDKQYIPLSFQIITLFKYLGDSKYDLSTDIWLRAIDIALYSIQKVVGDGNTAAVIIFQIYRQLNSKKYEIPYSRKSTKEASIERKQKAEREIAILSAIENYSTSNYRTYTSEEEFLFPNIIDDLGLLFSNFEVKSLYNNGTVNFPMLKWDGLSWLMKCASYWKYKAQITDVSAITYPLTRSFFSSYTSRIEVTEVTTYSYIKKAEVQKTPLWSEKIERLEYIDWIYPIYNMSRHQLLKNFLNPRFFFELTDNKYDDKNRFIADKLRTHLGVLIQLLRKLVRPSIPYGLEKKELLKIKINIEEQIIEYLTHHIKDIPKQGKIDLFTYYKEWGFHSSKKEALFPQIAQALNWFTKKEEIINAIIDSQDVIKILTIVELVTSEGIRIELIKKLKESDLISFLKSSNLSEQQLIRFKIGQYPELIGRIREIVDFFEKNTFKKDQAYQEQLYKNRLLLAYFDKNEVALNKVKAPPKKGSSHRKELSFENHRNFYKGLLKINTAPKIAYKIFDTLVKQHPQYPSLATNRMAAQINLAEKENNTKIYSEALEEWKYYENSNKDLDIAELGTIHISNKLLVLLKLERYEELDNELRNLDLPYQMLPGILEINIEGLVARDKVGEAMYLLDSAQNYHEFSGNEEIQFIQNLKKKFSSEENFGELENYYTRIFNSKPQDLIKIFPKKLNGKTNLLEFLVQEVARAAMKMLDKINALPNILTTKNSSKENRFSDLIQLALEARIEPWGWSVKEQRRKASAAKGGKDLGSIDLDIVDSNNSSILTCEAFNHKLKGTVGVNATEHIQKLIADYTPNKKALLVLVYFIGEHSDFGKSWKSYIKDIDKITYPVGYEPIPNGVKDVTTEFEEHSGIKIGKVHLNNEVILFHIFVNIKYKPAIV